MRPVGGARNEKMLRLDADVEDVAGGAQFAEDAFQIDARAIGETVGHRRTRSAAKRARPGVHAARRVGGRVDARHHVVRGSVLAHAPDRAAGETGAALRHGVQHLARDHLHLGRAVNVHELDEQIIHAVLLELDLQSTAVHVRPPGPLSALRAGSWLGRTHCSCIIAATTGLKRETSCAASLVFSISVSEQITRSGRRC